MPKTVPDILSEVSGIFGQVLGNPELVLDENTTANDVEGWDSLNHMALIAAVEQHFSIKFTLKDVMRFKNVGDMCRLIHTKLEA
jgi:acyl carrier protein